MSCRFCKGAKLLQVSAKCRDQFAAKLPERSNWSSGYNFVPGLMSDGDNDYLTFDVCMACQRVQGDLFEYGDKPKKGKKVWSVEEKLVDLRKRVEGLTDVLMEDDDPKAESLPRIIDALAEVDRCLPGLVRDMENGKAEPARSGVVRIKRSAASPAELELARTMPGTYQLVD